jgi:isopenicillin N synthase-like dioxygenase
VETALRTWGGFFVEVEADELPWRQALEAARRFFEQPHSMKADFDIDRSSHFRGWSEMRNERDWREQLHMGRDRPTGGPSWQFLTLEGPNLWPADEEWRQTLTHYMGGAAALGASVLRSVGQALHLEDAPFRNIARYGYLVMKLICYHAQSSSAAIRPGVAPHVDFSWLTLTLEDGPGLEIYAPQHGWVPIELMPGSLWVHPGEILQFASQGRFLATPHRVTNQFFDRTRISIPLFLSPALTDVVEVFSKVSASPCDDTQPSEHVHRVLLSDGSRDSLHFGQAEWQRKGLGHWCASCVPTAESRFA